MCSNLDEKSCAASSDCQVAECCGTFNGCYDLNGAPPACTQGQNCPQDCSNYKDEMSCNADPNCTSITCPSCNGGSPNFVMCWSATEPPPPVGCDCPAPVCDGLNEMQCLANKDCVPNYCDSCPPTKAFVGCTAPGEPPPPCPFDCPPPPPCSSLTDQMSCTARPDCHSVYTYEPCAIDCFVAPCCSPFTACADGPALCNLPEPVCAGGGPGGPGLPQGVCEAPYVPSYAGCTTSCCLFEGCVPPKECK
jgi:hypothetical protein